MEEGADPGVLLARFGLSGRHLARPGGRGGRWRHRHCARCAKVQHKVRLSGIDAPERSQAFGQRSKEHLSDLVFGQTVQVDFNKTDRYGRLIGKIVVNGQDANLQQLHAGMAWHYKEYEREQPAEERRRYAQAEVDARDRGVGLWKDPNPVPPWEFRRAQRQK